MQQFVIFTIENVKTSIKPAFCRACGGFYVQKYDIYVPSIALNISVYLQKAECSGSSGKKYH